MKMNRISIRRDERERGMEGVSGREREREREREGERERGGGREGGREGERAHC